MKGTDSPLGLPLGLTPLVICCNRAASGSASVLPRRAVDPLYVFQWCVTDTVTTAGSVCHQMSANAERDGAALLAKWVSG